MSKELSNPLSNLTISNQNDSENSVSGSSLAKTDDDWQVVSNVSKNKSKKGPNISQQVKPSVGKKVTSTNSKGNRKAEKKDGNFLKAELVKKKDTELHYYPPPPPPIYIGNEDNVSTTTTTDSKITSEQLKEFMLLLGSNKDRLKINSSDSRLTSKRRGITNTGCSCFRNAVLQVFMCLDPFINTLLRSLEAAGIPPSRLASLSSDADMAPYWLEFLSLLSEFSHLEGPSTDPQTPHPTRTAALNANLFMPRLIGAFQRSVASGSRKPRQEDAMEFLTFLLDSLHEEVGRARGPREGDTVVIEKDDKKPSKEEKEIEGEEWSVVKARHRGRGLEVDDSSRKAAEDLVASTVISRFFHGTLRSEVQYRARRMCSVTFQRFHCLTLDVRKPRTSVEQCLELYFKEEVVEDHDILKQLRLEHAPQVLVLQLARFSFDAVRGIPLKVQSEVEFREILELPGTYRSPPDPANASKTALPVRYELQSVVLHHGAKATGGHYSAHCRDGPDTWRNYNDTRVRVISRDELLSATQSVYLLFYLKHSPHTLGR